MLKSKVRYQENKEKISSEGQCRQQHLHWTKQWRSFSRPGGNPEQQQEQWGCLAGHAHAPVQREDTESSVFPNGKDQKTLQWAEYFYQTDSVMIQILKVLTVKKLVSRYRTLLKPSRSDWNRIIIFKISNPFTYIKISIESPVLFESRDWVATKTNLANKTFCGGDETVT